jgi:hypothetical protein
MWLERYRLRCSGSWDHERSARVFADAASVRGPRRPSDVLEYAV